MYTLGQRQECKFFRKENKEVEKRQNKEGNREKLQKYIQKNREIFIICEKKTLIHATSACMKGLKYALLCVKTFLVFPSNHLRPSSNYSNN